MRRLVMSLCVVSVLGSVLLYLYRRFVKKWAIPQDGPYDWMGGDYPI